MFASLVLIPACHIALLVLCDITDTPGAAPLESQLSGQHLRDELMLEMVTGDIMVPLQLPKSTYKLLTPHFLILKLMWADGDYDSTVA